MLTRHRLCPCICLFVRLSDASQYQNGKHCRITDHRLLFADAKYVGKIRIGHPKQDARWRWDRLKSAIFDISCYISDTV